MTSDRVALIKRRPLIVEEDIELGEGGRDRDNEYLSIPPAWIDDLEDIRYNATLISQKMKELDLLQSKHVQRPTFDDDTSTELQIEEVTQATTKVYVPCTNTVDSSHKHTHGAQNFNTNAQAMLICIKINVTCIFRLVFRNYANELNMLKNGMLMCGNDYN